MDIMNTATWTPEEWREALANGEVTLDEWEDAAEEAMWLQDRNERFGEAG